MKVVDLRAPELNFWAAKSAGLSPIDDGRSSNTFSVVDPVTGTQKPYQPCFDWSQAGPLIAEEWFEIEGMLIDWLGPNWPYIKEFREDSLTWLVRAFVAIKFGDEVEA
jgi:hypothetical protein